MTPQDTEEFLMYLEACTDRQLEGVLEKEKAAGREEYATLTQKAIDIRRMWASKGQAQ